MIKVTVWNENKHEKAEPIVTEIYPGGIHEFLAGMLRDTDIETRTATLDQEECGLTEEVLEDTDVLLWWGHWAHEAVPDEIVDRVHKRVLEGMGLIVLHSGHHSKIFKKLMGTSCNLQWREGSRERLWVIKPNHPIAAGVDPTFSLDPEEMYGEPFDIPEPQEVILLGWFTGGEVFRSGCTYVRGNGRIFYFQPGHESNRAFHNENVRKVIKNAVRWACPVQRKIELRCPNAKPMEGER